MRPTSGAVLLDGADISAMPINRRPFNTVFQDYALFPHMTVEANVGYGLRGPRRAQGACPRARRRDAAASSRSRTLAAAIPSQLSGGQQQRVALARAIICEPRLILLDEPLGALDAELRRQMQQFLKRLQREISTTFLFVTHDQEEAVTMADRICVMNHGRIEQIGSPEEVYYRPAQRIRRPLLRRQQPDRCLGRRRSRAPGERWRAGSVPSIAPASGSPGLADRRQSGKLLVRPEAIAIGTGAGREPRPRAHRRRELRRSGFAGPGSAARRSRTGADGQARKAAPPASR